MLTPQQRHIHLEAAFNVRDLGGYPTSLGTTTRWRSLLRADALHLLTPGDIDRLLAMDLRTVIDLRSEAEIASQPSVFSRHEEVHYLHIPLFDGLAPADAMFRDKGLIDLSERYIAAVETCRPALLGVAKAIAEAPDGAVLFNCTAGKDRTGIVAAMLLSIAGVSAEDIAIDYALTGEIAAPLMAQLREQAILRGLEEAMATRLLSSDRTAMEAFLRYIDESHVSFRNYLGNDADQQALVRQLEGRLIAA